MHGQNHIKFLLCSPPTGSTNNLMMVHLQGRNM